MPVGIEQAQLAAAIKADVSVAARLLPVVSLLVERFAPDAPDLIQDEAAIRCAGWLAEMNPNINIKAGNLTIRKTRYKGDLGALRSSGAMSLLSPWKVRRGGLI